jgi:histidine phosphotransferase ChpT
MADATLDLEIAELLAARLCHELVSPIGAIANGLEILEDEPDLAGDAGALIALSTRQASRRLQFYRVAYGATSIPTDALVRRIASDFFLESKIGFEWRIAALPEAWGKLACNLVLIAAEALPRGGTVILDGADAGGISVTASGEGARLTDPVSALLAGSAVSEALSARTVQAAFTAALARRGNAVVEVWPVNVNELALLVKVKS